jgi:PHD/YefM family antitoxin component YafN of YafNO toxin-antitoxin module
MLNTTVPNLRDNLEHYLQAATVQPVAVEEHGVPLVVIVSAKEHQILSDMENMVWILAAKIALEKDTFASHEESIQFLMNKLSEIN